MRGTTNSEAPKEAELYDLPEILEPYPQLAASRQHPGRVVARPSIVSGEKYEDVSRAYIRAVHSVLSREEIPSVAAAALEKELIQITGFVTGPPSNPAWSGKKGL
jgi:trehalose/maltose transport system substrate-binding protein